MHDRFRRVDIFCTLCAALADEVILLLLLHVSGGNIRIVRVCTGIMWGLLLIGEAGHTRHASYPRVECRVLPTATLLCAYNINLR